MTSCNYNSTDGQPQNRPKGTACVIETKSDGTVGVTTYNDGKCDGSKPQANCGI